MNGEKSRRLVVGARVCWNRSEADQGTVLENTWANVRIKWDNGLTGAVHHNDMGEVDAAVLKA
jgi:hypothetical protein